MYGKRLLLIDYVASTASGHSPDKALERKDKKSLPIPVRFVLYDFDIKSKCQKKTFSNLLHSFASGDTVQQRSIFTFQLPTFSNIRLLMLYFHFSQPYFMYTVKVHAFLFIYTKFFSKLTQVKNIVARVTIHHYSTWYAWYVFFFVCMSVWYAVFFKLFR